MEIFPAIDIMNGECVRLTQGRFEEREVYARDPLEVARRFEGAGLKRLHLVDLDGARAGKVLNWEVLERIAGSTNLSVDFGGGIATTEELRRVFASGAAQATIGTIAVRQQDLFREWLELFGRERFILAADVRAGMIAVRGWQEETRIDVVDLIRQKMADGLSCMACTEIERDGAMGGPAVALYKKLTALFPGLRLIASGGVASMADVAELKASGVWGVIIGKAIYRGMIRLEELAEC